MTLYLTGLGLSDEKSISLKGLKKIKSSKEVYLENYTSLLQCPAGDLENFYGKKIMPADRSLIEGDSKEIIKKAKKENISILIPGDVFSATTHISLFQEAKKNNVPVEVINNASILTAVGITGLEIYKFGKTASIPFENKNVESPIKILKDNLKINAHTLFLLDLNPEENKYLSIREAILYLGKNNIKEMVVGCARLGSENFVVKYGSMDEIKNANFGKGPYCLIVPAKKLHFIEEEVLEKWKI